MATKMLNSITNVETILGYHFTDCNWLWEALQAPGSGVSIAGTRRIYDGNKRLALKGDAAIKNVIITDWFTTSLPRGRNPLAPHPRIFQLLTSRQIAVADNILQTQVSNNNLQRMCTEHGLERYINLNPSSRGYISPRTRYDTMEAILGAVAEDGGDEVLRAVMRRLGFIWHDSQ